MTRVIQQILYAETSVPSVNSVPGARGSFGSVPGYLRDAGHHLVLAHRKEGVSHASSSVSKGFQLRTFGRIFNQVFRYFSFFLLVRKCC